MITDASESTEYAQTIDDESFVLSLITTLDSESHLAFDTNTDGVDSTGSNGQWSELIWRGYNTSSVLSQTTSLEISSVPSTNGFQSTQNPTPVTIKLSLDVPSSLLYSVEQSIETNFSDNGATTIPNQVGESVTEQPTTDTAETEQSTTSPYQVEQSISEKDQVQQTSTTPGQVEQSTIYSAETGQSTIITNQVDQSTTIPDQIEPSTTVPDQVIQSTKDSSEVPVVPSSFSPSVIDDSMTVIESPQGSSSVPISQDIVYPTTVITGGSIMTDGDTRIPETVDGEYLSLIGEPSDGYSQLQITPAGSSPPPITLGNGDTTLVSQYVPQVSTPDIVITYEGSGSHTKFSNWLIILCSLIILVS